MKTAKMSLAVEQLAVFACQAESEFADTHPSY
jgi:hypothetical protein